MNNARHVWACRSKQIISVCNKAKNKMMEFVHVRDEKKKQKNFSLMKNSIKLVIVGEKW